MKLNQLQERSQVYEKQVTLDKPSDFHLFQTNGKKCDLKFNVKFNMLLYKIAHKN